MSLLERVLEAAGGDRWPAVRRFTSHLMLDGPLLAPLQGPYSFKEIVAEGDIASRSIRISGFSGAGAQWGFHPDFITIQHDDGAFVSARQPSAPRSFRGHKNEADLVYICGLSIWICLTGPLAMLSEGVSCQEKERDDFAPPSCERPPVLALPGSATGASGSFCSIRPAISLLSGRKLILCPVLATDVPLTGSAVFSASLLGAALAGKGGGAGAASFAGSLLEASGLSVV